MKNEYLQPRLELYPLLVNCGILNQSITSEDPLEEDIL